jgi:hypothetical protein
MAARIFMAILDVQIRIISRIDENGRVENLSGVQSLGTTNEIT